MGQVSQNQKAFHTDPNSVAAPLSATQEQYDSPNPLVRITNSSPYNSQIVVCTRISQLHRLHLWTSMAQASQDHRGAANPTQSRAALASRLWSTNTSSPARSDLHIILSTLAGASLLYIVLSKLLGKSQIPLLVSVYIVASMTTRLNGIRSLLGRWSAPPLPSSAGASDNFARLSESAKSEVLTAIKAFQTYSAGCRRSDARRRKLFKLMSWRQQKLAEDVGYLKKLDTVEKLGVKNAHFMNKLVDAVVDDFGIHYTDFGALKDHSESSSSSYRVIESIGHFARDWHGDVPEIDPIIGYIRRALSKVIPEAEKANTVLVVPGSGLGRIAHELALDSYGAVHAIEFSGLMYLCNKFLYLAKDSTPLYPYIHTCSNYSDTKSQERSVTIAPVAMPSNLQMHLTDFRFFDIPDLHKYDNVVVVSAYFIDTAENLMDYIDAINSLTTPSKKNAIKRGYWINIGPLKYGSAPQVEFNDDELTQIRAKVGWTDIDKVNTLQKPLGDGDSGLYKYVTDTKSFWQGFYGLTGWCSRRKENPTK